jgi:hypothetical protein
MGERQVDQGALFYEFSLEKHVPVDHMLRSIDRFVVLRNVRRHLAPFYSTTMYHIPSGCPSRWRCLDGDGSTEGRDRVER